MRIHIVLTLISLTRYECAVLFLEVLVVLDRVPAAAPSEAVCGQNAVGRVGWRNLVTEGSLAVGVASGGGGLYGDESLVTPDTGVEERVDVNGSMTLSADKATLKQLTDGVYFVGDSYSGDKVTIDLSDYGKRYGTHKMTDIEHQYLSYCPTGKIGRAHV